MKDMRRYRELMQEHAYTRGITDLYDLYRKRERELAETRNLLESEKDHTMKEMIREELAGLQEKQESLLSELKTALIPRDPLDQKNIIMEIRAGTGGEEAALFAADLFACTPVSRRAGLEKRNHVDEPDGDRGFKEIIYSCPAVTCMRTCATRAACTGSSGSETESGGRIHTSAVTVACFRKRRRPTSDRSRRPQDRRLPFLGPGVRASTRLTPRCESLTSRRARGHLPGREVPA
jgi:peptide chain release factor 1